MNNAKIQGEPVSLELNSSDAHTAALPILIKDSAFAARVLAANERLIIDSLQADVVTGAVPVIVFADLNANGAVDAGELIAAFDVTATQFSSELGLSLPLAIVPSVLAAASGQVYITGAGRIVAETPGYNSYGRMPSGKNQG